MKCVYNNKNNGLAIINVINNRLNISNDWKKNNKRVNTIRKTDVPHKEP